MVAEHEGTRLAVDVGMKIHDHNEYPQGIANLKVDAAIVTHAHLDHVGALPYFYKPHAGKPGMGHIATFCTPPTIPFSLLLLEDAEKVAIKRRKPGLATKKDLSRLSRNFFALPYEKRYDFAGNLSFEFYDAGHIAGAAQVLIEHDRKKLLYSGDLKLLPTRMHEGAVVPRGQVDALVVECCYAMRDQPDRRLLERNFCENVRSTLEAGEPVLVPSFAVGRTQEVLQILDAGHINAETYVDGMGAKTSAILRDFPTYVRNYTALSNAVRKAHFIDDPQQRKKLLKKPCVIVATAGMLDGGPALGYLTRMNNMNKGKVLLTGYQVEGTNGRTLIEHRRINVEGQGEVKVRIPFAWYSFSAHASRSELFSYVDKLSPEKIFAIHGDEQSCTSFVRDLKARGYDAVAPRVGDRFDV
jgi:putative mRNA 3-end processing factor